MYDRYTMYVFLAENLAAAKLLLAAACRRPTGTSRVHDLVPLVGETMSFDFLRMTRHFRNIYLTLLCCRNNNTCSQFMRILQTV